MIKRIFITTNITRLRENITGTRQDELGIEQLGHNNCNALYLNENNRFDTNTTSSSLILIFDESYPITITNIGEINTDTDGLLHHTTTPQNEQYTQFLHKKEGLHENTDEHLYKPVFKIIFDNDNNKAQRIIEFLFPTADSILGKKLDLLHSLLVPPIDFTDADTKWKEIGDAIKNAPKEANVSPLIDDKALETFKNAVSGKTDAFDKGYLEALTILRDALLV